MRFTDIFVQRPVLASVVSLMILVLGLRSIFELEVRQYPKTENTVVTVTTSYPGADSQLVKGFISQPLQAAIAEADGIDYMQATSVQGKSTIEVFMRLNYDGKAAVAEIQAKVASQRANLPAAAEDPVITFRTGDVTALMYIAYYSRDMSLSQITDYLIRVVQPQLQAVPGVARAEMIGNKTFSMRIWLQSQRMAALNVTATDVEDVLRRNNYLSGAGRIRGNFVGVDVSANTDAATVEDFERLVVANRDGAIVRLADIARIELGSEDYESQTLYKGIPAIFMAIEQAPGQNPLEVAKRVHETLPKVKAQFPTGLEAHIPYDGSRFINDSIEEVFKTLGEALLIVLTVIFLTLGSLRAAIIPALAVPLSLTGAAFLMLLLGYSINLLTLLAMVLAIGLVVDDAIVVVENVHRHIEMGKTRFQAAIDGVRELALPIIAMTTTLVAVYLPVGFQGGLVGALFTEFAYSLAGAVLISGVVALTLSPMLSSLVLREKGQSSWFERLVERFFHVLESGYGRSLHWLMEKPSVMLLAGVLVLGGIYFMLGDTKQELAPTEDQSILLFQATGPQTATSEFNELFIRELQGIFETIPEYHESFILVGFGGDPSTTFGGFKMEQPDKRQRSQMAIFPELQGKLGDVAGLQVAMFPRPTLPSPVRGLPFQILLVSDADYDVLDGLAGQLQGKGMASGKFLFLKKTPSLDRPQLKVLIDRDRAASLGVDMREIGRALSTLLGESYVNRFSLAGRSYKVIPQAEQSLRDSPEKLSDYYVRSNSGQLVALGNLVRFERTVGPSSRTQFQQLNSITVQGIVTPGVALGDAIGFLQDQASQLFPNNVSLAYLGEARQFFEQGSDFIITIILSVLVIYLVLAAQFESWRDPVIVLVSVPLSIAGAMIFLYLGFASLNIYTKVGLITLIGLISKNGILIVEFANQLREREGLHKREAVEKASVIRLRPILMTTVSMVVAMVPLLLASGPGAVSRFEIGLVIAAGLGIGTIFTLYVVPGFYLLLSGQRGSVPASASGPG